MINEAPLNQQKGQEKSPPTGLDNKSNKQNDEKENQPKKKVLLPISWREELYMVKDKVVEDIEQVFNHHMKVDPKASENQLAELEQIKYHFQKRLKGFYNHIILTIRDNAEYVNFDNVKKSQNEYLFTKQNLSLEQKNKETLNQFREIINKTEVLKEKVMDQFQEKLDKELKLMELELLAKRQQQQAEQSAKQGNQDQFKAQKSQVQQPSNIKNILKVKDDKGQEKEIDLAQCIKVCIDQYQKNISNDIDRIKNLQPELKEQLNSFHINTRQHIKKTIEFQYAIESIKNQKDQSIFRLPTMPSDLFD